jgi:hypothetical protein
VVLAGGGLSVIVYQAFKHLAARWLDSKFDERLQALKHQHGKELEQLRFKIAALLDRATKLHQREFEVLPDAWAKLNDAYWSARASVASIQQLPDLNRMVAPQLEEFITNCKLATWEKDHLRQLGESKNKFYREHIFLHELTDAQEKAQIAYAFSIKNGIFVDDQIGAKFMVIHDLIWNALVEQRVNEEYKNHPKERPRIDDLNSRGEALMKELERVVRERLWPEESVQL